MISAIIMASGQSKRMGVNKLLLPYKGKYLIEHTLEKVINCQFNHVILVAEHDEVLALGKRLGVQAIKNNNASHGQSESIKLGILNSPDASGYAFFTGDQPLMDCVTICHLIQVFNDENECIIVPSYKDKRGTPVLFPNFFKDDLLALQGDKGGRFIISNHLNKVKTIEIGNETFLFDIDTLEDYERLITM